MLNRYKNEFCILQELIQNADDAQAERVFVGIVDTLSDKHPLLAAPALFIINDGPVTRSNIQSIKEVGNSDKTADGKKIGKFGLGMKSVFHLAEGFFLFGQNSPVEYPYFVTPWTKSLIPAGKQPGMRIKSCLLIMLKKNCHHICLSGKDGFVYGYPYDEKKIWEMFRQL